VEYAEVALPIKELLGEDGKLDIYADVAGKGYFDIDYRRGELVLKAKGHVGLIPISDRIAIRVEPRVSIHNLLYMVWRSGAELVSLRQYVRQYRDIPGSVKDPERLYVQTFLTAMRRAGETGLLKRYIRRRTESEMRGRLLLGATVSRFRSRGIKDQHAFEVHDHTVNIAENQILKATATRLLQRMTSERSPQGVEATRELRHLLSFFGAVDPTAVTSEWVARQVPRLVRGLPNSHLFYEPGLWLSYLISTRSGVAMEAVGRAKFETVIIDVADVFERYVRKLCQEHSGRHFGGCSVIDGNSRSVPLFVSGEKFPSKPDIYFKSGAMCLAVADAKYKPKVSSEDRYELLAFCESLGVKSAAFLCPALSGQPLVSHHGTTVSGKCVHVVRIDLAAESPDVEEREFVTRLSKALGFPRL
jgi:5-methylcytosine-specific restriction enzyme subunit McrC